MEAEGAWTWSLTTPSHLAQDQGGKSRKSRSTSTASSRAITSAFRCMCRNRNNLHRPGTEKRFLRLVENVMDAQELGLAQMASGQKVKLCHREAAAGVEDRSLLEEVEDGRGTADTGMHLPRQA